MESVEIVHWMIVETEWGDEISGWDIYGCGCGYCRVFVLVPLRVVVKVLPYPI